MNFRVEIFLTFAALFLADVSRVLQVVQRENVLHLGLSVDDRASAVLDACLDLLAQELLHIVWLLVRQKRGQVLPISNYQELKCKYSDCFRQVRSSRRELADPVRLCLARSVSYSKF